MEISVVHIHLVEAELQVGEHRKLSLSAAVIAQPQIPDLYRIVHRNKQFLFCSNTAVVAVVLYISEAMATGKTLLLFAHGLP